jgi:hypothetical protein
MVTSVQIILSFKVSSLEQMERMTVHIMAVRKQRFS